MRLGGWAAAAHNSDDFAFSRWHRAIGNTLCNQRGKWCLLYVTYAKTVDAVRQILFTAFKCSMIKLLCVSEVLPIWTENPFVWLRLPHVDVWMMWVEFECGWSLMLRRLHKELFFSKGTWYDFTTSFLGGKQKWLKLTCTCALNHICKSQLKKWGQNLFGLHSL